MRRKDRPRLLKERPIRSLLGERPTLIIEKPLLGPKSSVDGERRGLLGWRRRKFVERPEFVERPNPKEHSHLSYEGQSELDYCLECIVNKHGPTGKTLMTEALQRARAGSPSDPGGLEKVRGVVDELAGIEDDSDTVKNEKVEALNDLARTLRKHIYATKADIGGASLDDLREIKGMMDKLVDAAYQVRVSEEGPCIGCTVEELCGGNLECVKFVEKAAKGVKDPEEFQTIIREAREKYRRGLIPKRDDDYERKRT